MGSFSSDSVISGSRKKVAVVWFVLWPQADNVLCIQLLRLSPWRLLLKRNIVTEEISRFLWSVYVHCHIHKSTLLDLILILTIPATSPCPFLKN